MSRRFASLFLAVAALAGVARADELTGRPLTLSAVDRVVEENDHAVQACARARAKDTLAVLIRLDIDPEGRVLGAAADWQTAESKCLERVARRLKFPATGTFTHVNYPFMLEPQLHHR